MRSGFRVRWTAVGLALACPAAAGAQTSDLVFGGWSWRSRDPGSRPAGLGGAYVAVADGVRTVSLNPAGLSLIPKAEMAAGTGGLWGGLAYSLGHSAAANPPASTPSAGPTPPPPGRPTQPAAPVPCTTPRQTRPWVVALFGEQAVSQDNRVDVVRGPGLSESGRLGASAEEIGAGLARGVTPWLDLGLTVAWRHVTMDGQTTRFDLAGDALSVVEISGDSNKARAVAGALLTFGPARDPTAFRLGLAYHRDLFGWSVQRTAIDRVRGVVTSPPAAVSLEEPPVLAGGLAWRNDVWMVSAELDYIGYGRVRRALERNSGPEAALFTLPNGLEPRLGLEMTQPSPTGGYYKLRAGFRRETSGRLEYVGSEPALRQAFATPPAAFRASVGASLLFEFYDNAMRFDVDLSQVVVERLTTVSAAGRRRLSLGVTVRM